MISDLNPLSVVNYSIIIATRNHPNLLNRCLAALSRVQPPSEGWEVLVMDNSEKRLRVDNAQVVDSLHEPRFRYVSMTSWGSMAARHQGVELASGRIISFIDDDSFVSETWLQGIEQSFRYPNVSLVCGPNRPEYETTPPDWLDYFWGENEHGRYLGYLSLSDFGNEPKEILPTFVWSCNYSIRKEIFMQVKGSHPDYLPDQWKSFQGDGEGGLSVKVAALGFQAHYSPLCSIRHWVPASRMTFDYFGNRAFFNGLHNSFTNFRREYGLGPLQGVPYSPSFRRARAWAGRIKRRLIQSIPSKSREPDDVVKLRQHLEKCYQDGWNYHRSEIKRDARLREFVLRPDFMGNNACIPER